MEKESTHTEFARKKSLVKIPWHHGEKWPYSNFFSTSNRSIFWPQENRQSTVENIDHV